MSKRTRLKQPNPGKPRLMMSVCQPEPGRAMRLSDGSVYARGEDGALRRVGTAVREKDRKAAEKLAPLFAKTPPDGGDSGADGIEAGAQ